MSEDMLDQGLIDTNCPVYTKNVAEMRGQRVMVPNLLPQHASELPGS